MQHNLSIQPIINFHPRVQQVNFHPRVQQDKIVVATSAAVNRILA